MAAKPKVKSESSYSYTNKFHRRKLTFKPKADEVVATFSAPPSEETLRGVTEGAAMAVSRGVNLERGVAVFQVPPEGDLAAARSALGDQAEVGNSLPVLIDQDGLTRYFVPDELTVQFRDGVTPRQAESLIKKQGSSIVVAQRTPGYYTVSVPAGKGLFETLRAFSGLDEVAFAEPSELGFDDALYLPDDPDFAKLWGLHNTGQVVDGVTGSADADIDAPAAWDLNRGNPEVIVAVIDTGCDLDHPDLAANLLPRGSEDWDFADGADPVPDDTNGHGTHVAGTAAAVDNTLGVIGVAPRCRIMPLRVNLTSGFNQNRADAINYVAQQALANPGRRYVINCSWKMSGDHAGVHNAILNALNRNVVVVFAAGNANQNIDVTPQFPAVYPEVIAVAATDQRDRRASFSNFGTKVDVSAPGVNIFSTFPNDTFTFLDGTSMASPHAAGVAALIWSRNRGLSNQQVRTLLETTCDNIDPLNPGFEGKLGRGRINALRALQATPIFFELLRRFPFPQRNNGSSTGLTFARRFPVGLVQRSVVLFLTQQPGSERIFFLNPASGAVLGSVDPSANDTIGSLDWDGSAIRVANVTTGAGFINAIHPRTGAQVGAIPAPSGRGEGLAFDGRFLYYSTITRIHVLNPSTGAVVRSIPAPGGECRSLAAGGGFLFCGKSSSGTITVFRTLLTPAGVLLALHGTIAAPGGGSARVEGLGFNPGTRELFIANQSENLIYVGRVSL